MLVEKEDVYRRKGLFRFVLPFSQQERQLIGQMEEVLQRELAKTQAQLAEERASNARRVGALQKELDVARRQLELERNRATKVRVVAVGFGNPLCRPGIRLGGSPSPERREVQPS